MVFKELINKMVNTEVLDTIVEKYPDQKDLLPAYFNMMEKLKNMSSKESDLLLTVVPVEDLVDEGEFYDDVCGIDKNSKESYAIEFTPWEEWLGMEVNQKSIEFYGATVFVAHCLYEMSFISFDEEDINKEMNTLLKIEQEIKDGTAKTYTMDEVYKSLGIEKPVKTPKMKQEEKERVERILKRNKEIYERFLD